MAPSMPPQLDSGLQHLIDAVAERQRQDFGHVTYASKEDGSLITACDRWSDDTIVRGLAGLYPGEGSQQQQSTKGHQNLHGKDQGKGGEGART